ncbi:YjjG family noncanonical pyrimidine nucleotidase [Nostoc ellipsosporum NOK]|nr:YjjG family noncanonical pyrimidine nucleotidase [Nostoc ellipsosporum NOK]
MKKYTHLFFDLDHTLWDFEANARATLTELYSEMELAERGVHDFDLFYRNYLAHNERLWERYRKGYIPQAELRVKRMWLALLDFKIADDKLSARMSERFLEMLPTRNLLFPHTIEILEYLRDRKYQLHLITNGFEVVQHSKLRNSGLDKFFGEVITSEGSNSLKPNKEIFEFAFRKTAATAESSIMIGDTPDADIQGAINVGMDQVFVNHTRIESTIKSTYTVHSLKELEAIF